jgi:hypothetical protein
MYTVCSGSQYVLFWEGGEHGGGGNRRRAGLGGQRTSFPFRKADTTIDAMADLIIDFVAFDDARDACLMVLVEEGPWAAPISDRLSQLQDRIYACLEAALEGRLAEQFPQSRGRTIVVQIDCYGLPRSDVDAFVERFRFGVGLLADYAPENSPYVSQFAFEARHFA